MHVLKYHEVAPELGPLAKPDVPYLLEDATCGSYMHSYSYTVDVCKWEGSTVLDPETDYNGKKILVMRAGGIGDILFSTPGIKAFKQKFPEAQVFFSAMGSSPLMLYGNPDITGFLPYPCPLAQVPDHVVAFEHILEYSAEGQSVHAVDLFAGCFGLTLAPDQKAMVLNLNDDEIDAAQKFLPPVGKGKFRFGIQVESNLPVRTYPHMARVAASLQKAGHQVVAFGVPGQPQLNGCINTHGQSPPLNIRQSSTLVSQCDCVIAPDSSIAHIAGALGIPCIALYGSFLASLRTQYAPRTLAIQAEGMCAPCFHHGRMSNFPPGCPSAKEGECKVLGSISVETVRDQALSWAGEWKE